MKYLEKKETCMIHWKCADYPDLSAFGNKRKSKEMPKKSYLQRSLRSHYLLKPNENEPLIEVFSISQLVFDFASRERVSNKSVFTTMQPALPN